MVRHDHPCVQFVMSDLCAALERGKDYIGDGGLPEERRAASGLLQKAIHGNEGFATCHVAGGKSAMRGKAAVEAAGDEDGLAGNFEMGKSASSHVLVVPASLKHFPGGLRGCPTKQICPTAYAG